MVENNATIGITFALYLILMLVIGIIAYKRTTNLSDYILGGRSLGPWTSAISAGASDMSGWLLLGLPGRRLRQRIVCSLDCRRPTDRHLAELAHRRTPHAHLYLQGQ